jgi:hypothetical protein
MCVTVALPGCDSGRERADQGHRVKSGQAACASWISYRHQVIGMASGTAENIAARLEMERHASDRGAARDLRARIAELPAAHPSAVGYLSDQLATRERQHRDLPRAASPADYAGDADIRAADDRRTHILDGDKTGGGHRHGTGVPDKTEFPADWDDDQIIDAILAVARTPDREPEHQNWNDRWKVSGQHKGVEIFAIVESDGAIWTAWPGEGSPGVVKNPVEDT